MSDGHVAWELGKALGTLKSPFNNYTIMPELQPYYGSCNLTVSVEIVRE